MTECKYDRTNLVRQANEYLTIMDREKRTKEMETLGKTLETAITSDEYEPLRQAVINESLREWQAGEDRAWEEAKAYAKENGQLPNWYCT